MTAFMGRQVRAQPGKVAPPRSIRASNGFVTAKNCAGVAWPSNSCRGVMGSVSYIREVLVAVSRNLLAIVSDPRVLVFFLASPTISPNRSNERNRLCGFQYFLCLVFLSLHVLNGPQLRALGRLITRSNARASRHRIRSCGLACYLLENIPTLLSMNPESRFAT